MWRVEPSWPSRGSFGLSMMREKSRAVLTGYSTPTTTTHIRPAQSPSYSLHTITRDNTARQRNYLLTGNTSSNHNHNERQRTTRTFQHKMKTRFSFDCAYRRGKCQWRTIRSLERQPLSFRHTNHPECTLSPLYLGCDDCSVGLKPDDMHSSNNGNVAERVDWTRCTTVGAIC